MSTHAIFDKKNVLITGGAGFIGSHLCDHLVKNAKVICIDNFSSGSESNIDHLLVNPNFKFIKHDMTEPIELEQIPELAEFKIEFQGIQEIYNLACPTSSTDFEKNRLGNILANSLAVKNSLDLANKYKAKYLHLSSSVVYGSRRDNNFKVSEEFVGEVDQLSERCSYDEGKRFAESMIKTYRDVMGIDAKIIRLFRVYGPRLALNQGLLIADFVKDALDNKNLVIYGDASFSSSLCYIDDCISAILKMMDSDLFGPINIGSDIDINLTDLANKIIKMVGSDSKIVYEPPKLFTTPLCLPDISKARDLLDWMPLIDIDLGLQKTIEDLRAAKNIKHLFG